MKKPKRVARPQLLDTLEQRCVPATLYVGLPTDFSITKDVAPTGLSANDIVTWKGSDDITGLTFGVNAFTSVKSAVSAASAGSTIKVDASTYSDGVVTVNANNLSFDIPKNASGFSLVAGSATTIKLTGNGSVPVTGNDLGVTIIGNSGANVITGGAGNDLIQGGGGNDTIEGGAGIDTVQYNEDFGNYTVTISGGVVKVTDRDGDDGSGSVDGVDTISGVEILQFKDKSVRVVPSSNSFTVGTTDKPVSSGLYFGASFVNSGASGSNIQVNLGLDGKTTSGWFTASNDGTLKSLSVNQTNIQLSGSANAINAYLNSGKIQYCSASKDQRTITLTCANDNVNPQTGFTVISPSTSSANSAPVFTSPNNAQVVYGTALSFNVTATASPAATFSITTGSLPTGLTLDSTSGLLSGKAAAGTYNFTITATSGTQTAAQPFTLTVNKAALTVSANASSKTYGEADPSLTYSITTGSLASGDSLTGSLSRAAGETVNTYAISQNTLSAGPNYNVTFVGANFTVNKATLSITADAKTKTYGNADPSFTYQVAGLKNSDTSSILTGALSRSAGENAGAYAIGVGTVSASSNYTVNYTGANLTVNKATLSITADAKAKTYGDADPSFTYQVAGLKNGDTSSILTGALSRSAGENAGAYAIGVGSVSASSNYTVNYTGANLTIQQRSVQVTASDVNGTYGTAGLGLGFSVSNMAAGESIGAVDFATNAPRSGAGNYRSGSWTITPSGARGGKFNPNNYNINYVNGNFNVAKATLNVVSSGSSRPYNGNNGATVTLGDDRKAGDLVTVNAATTTYSDANVGFSKTITAAGLSLSGADAGNYALAANTATATGNISGGGVINNVLNVIGTDDAEEIIIGLNMSNKTQGLITRIAGGVRTVTSFPLAGLTRVVVHGSGGNDKLTMNAEVPLPCTLYGDDGNDILRGGNYDDSLYGGEGDDTLYGSLGNDYLDGGNGSDTLNGQDGNDILMAGQGDTLPNKLDGGDGSDILYGSNGSNTLIGGTDNAKDGGDTIYGYDGNNTIFGGGGNDVIIVGNGNNSIEGASGNDSIKLGNGNNVVNDVSGDDLIVAGDGNNTINAGIGNDSITVGKGNNYIQGGDGNDSITVGDGANLVYGSGGDDTIIAGNGNNILMGGAGADSIRAGAGNNLIVGGTGIDTIVAGDGANLVIGGYTSFDSNATSLRAIEAEWTRTDLTIEQKQSELTAGINGLKLAAGSTVIDDLAHDVVTLGKGKNWIWS